MFIAHLPAGYLWTRYLLRRRFATDVRSLLYRKLMALGLAGSLLPDVDMLYFYFIDNRQHLHHGYWTHIPLYWLALFGMSLLAGRLLDKPSLRPAAAVLFSNVFIHLGLDTVVGKVRWFAPFSGRDFVLFEVPAQHGWWVWNFMFHWTILLELAIVIAAVVTFLISRRTRVAAKL
ncbi:MAG TPA: metal-dependent hydrolase [Nitrospirota bacterium]|nr:metal-dependent hydrolase [Nitrospirota bacterium]